MSNHAHDQDADHSEFAATTSDDSDLGTTYAGRGERGRSATERADRAPNPAGGQLSIIGPGLTFKGDLSAEDDLLIQGRVDGSIKHTGANLTIGAHGKIKADIVGRKVIVQGEVRGDIRASESVSVEMSANVQGNLFAPRVGIKDGAKFRGSIDMDAAPAQATARSPEASANAAAKSNNKAKRRSGRELGDPSVDALLE